MTTGPGASRVTQKLYIRTFGCQMNEYDSDKMADVLAADGGYSLTDRPENADVILFNTCSVRERAQERVFHDLGRVRGLKNERPDLIIGVGGCVASQEGAGIVGRAPYVDVVFGPQTLHRLPALIRARRATGEPQVDITFPAIEKFDQLPPSKVEGASAFLSIMEGCSKYCTFCVVPYTRGEEVSRPFDDVLTEVGRSRRPGRDGADSSSDRTSTPIARRWARRPRPPISPRCSITSPRCPASSASATRRRIRKR
jgi:tRNA-2-methylthio-N6-dimethylallyladenosine synthase